MHDSPTSPCAAPPQWARLLGTHSFDDALSSAVLPHRCHSLSRLMHRHSFWCGIFELRQGARHLRVYVSLYPC